MHGANNGLWDIWIADDGTPEMIPFSGAPPGQHYDEDALQDILKKY